MNEKLKIILKHFDLNPNSSIEIIREVEKKLNIKFPSDYVELMSAANGGEGKVGDAGYLVLWKIDDLLSLNEAYEVFEFAPGLILFGSDGGDTAYAFDSFEKKMSIVEVPFIGMSRESIKKCGDSVFDFLNTLSKQ